MLREWLAVHGEIVHSTIGPASARMPGPPREGRRAGACTRQSVDKRIVLGSHAQQPKVALARRVAPVCRRGNLQRAADRLDPATSAVLVDEDVHFLSWRSNSAWAKYALANFRISLNLRSSRTSRSSSLIRCFSAVVTPGRTPLSHSPWRTPRRSVSAVQPIFAEIDSIAARCDGYWSLASKTMRTARSTTTGENYRDFLMFAPFSIEGASSKSGAVHVGSSRERFGHQ